MIQYLLLFNPFHLFLIFILFFLLLLLSIVSIGHFEFIESQIILLFSMNAIITSRLKLIMLILLLILILRSTFILFVAIEHRNLLLHLIHSFSGARDSSRYLNLLIAIYSVHITIALVDCASKRVDLYIFCSQILSFASLFALLQSI